MSSGKPNIKERLQKLHSKYFGGQKGKDITPVKDKTKKQLEDEEKRKFENIFSKLKSLDNYFNRLYWSLGKGQISNIEAVKRLSVFDFYSNLEIHDQEQDYQIKELEKQKAKTK